MLYFQLKVLITCNNNHVQQSSELSTDQTCLTSFELSDYHQLINDCVIGLYQALVTQAEDQLLPIIGTYDFVCLSVCKLQDDVSVSGRYTRA